jgi:hypothetical protein
MPTVAGNTNISHLKIVILSEYLQIQQLILNMETGNENVKEITTSLQSLVDQHLQCYHLS